MKTNELMIGDWVIARRRYNEKTIHRTTLANDDFFFTNFAHLNPVPLRFSILESNGFQKAGCFCQLQHKHFTITIGEYTCDGERPSKSLNCQIASSTVHIDIDIDYVHELQHALRLAGLSDIADGLKIE